MKKTCVLLSLLITGTQASAQSAGKHDSLPRNEISASFLPVLVLFSGYEPVGRYGFYSFGYKRYLDNNEVLRASFNFAPDWVFRSDTRLFLETRDSINIFTTANARVRSRFQLNLGFEKLFRTKNFIHGFGVEMLVRKQVYSYNNTAYWYPVNADPNSIEVMTKYSPDRAFPGRIYNGIDSLYYSYDLDDLGLGIQLIYTLRYKINKHFYLSSSMGPYLMMITYTFTNQRGNKERFRSGVHNRFDGHIFLVSDVSLAFRF